MTVEAARLGADRGEQLAAARDAAPVEPRLAGGALERQPMVPRRENAASATTETAIRRLCLVKI